MQTFLTFGRLVLDQAAERAQSALLILASTKNGSRGRHLFRLSFSGIRRELCSCDVIALDLRFKDMVNEKVSDFYDSRLVSTWAFPGSQLTRAQALGV